ncbi:hypothetical protein C8N46_10943 [Kordia periserrulae]|uniref:Lipocalin-like protein n=1 Tax=Kordia periserrulae TaxID=701523 RepID=A0A2T6BTP9_9FLAO|nr:hypothetical protein [Kordia periserrulae]PTX59455.1 hypothetical protein C8N46_10943 [Kordia periserrulae]
MKTLTQLLATALLCTLAFTSCRTEETEIIEPPQEQTLEINSPVKSLMQRTATNDGSLDNIIDNANCVTIQLPVTVVVNGLQITVDSEDDFQTIEDIFEEFDDDGDELIIEFPITIILSDFSEIVINNATELATFTDNCTGENEVDDDIECLDFNYPIVASFFNTNNELLETISIMNDAQMYEFIDDIDENDIITVQFPISVTTYDGETITINNFAELENVINTYDDACDEDDDNDYNDDDCDNCTNDQLTSVLSECSNWMVDKLERNDNDLEDTYVGYNFNFGTDGSIQITSGGGNFTGTWQSSGTGNNISVTITIPDLPDFNATWNLHEIDQEDNETKVDLRLGDDRLRFESDCSSSGNNGNVDDTALVNSLTTGDWYITYYFDDTDETADYTDYVFNFASDGSATANLMGTITNGFWNTSAGDETALELNLNFGTTIPLDELAEDWDVLEVTNDIIRLKDVSGGDGDIDYLTFERNPSGGSGNNLNAILETGTWIVDSYTDDGVDETADYNGYQLTFMNNGTVQASNGTTINGTWDVQNAGNTLLLNFEAIPFDEFNDDWDVISVSETQVILQDVSGGGGGTDVLKLSKL